MTDQDLNVSMTPLIQVVTGSTGERVFAFSDMGLDADPATISDRDLVSAVARHLDRPESEFAGLVVTRPQTGNILLSPKPTFGSDEMDILGGYHKTLLEIGRDIDRSETFSYGHEDAQTLALIAIAKALQLSLDIEVYKMEQAQIAYLEAVAESERRVKALRHR